MPPSVAISVFGASLAVPPEPQSDGPEQWQAYGEEVAG